MMRNEWCAVRKYRWLALQPGLTFAALTVVTSDDLTHWFLTNTLHRVFWCLFIPTVHSDACHSADNETNYVVKHHDGVRLKGAGGSISSPLL